jgi:hypothetical protein
MNHLKLSNKELKDKIYFDYKQELQYAKRNNRVRVLNSGPCPKDSGPCPKQLPLYLYSIRVYRAYRNVWRLIERKLLTDEEIYIMLQLGIYKLSQREAGIRYSNLPYEEKIKICKTRIKI